jgi:hypothetical protein
MNAFQLRCPSESPRAQEKNLSDQEWNQQAGVLRDQAALVDLSQDAILVQAIDAD